jgi:hypothetical protein
MGKDGNLYFIDTIPHSVDCMNDSENTEADRNDGIRFHTMPPVPEPPEVTKNDSFGDVVKKHIEYVKSLEVYKDQFDEQAGETSDLYRYKGILKIPRNVSRQYGV